jgi:hypothetical protein
MARLPGVPPLTWQKDWDDLKVLIHGDEYKGTEDGRESRCAWLAMRIAAQMNWNASGVVVTAEQVVAVASLRMITQNPANN